MSVTQLSPNGVSGGRYSFSPKTEGTISKGVGPFTALSANGLTGQIRTFLAKTPEVPGVSKGVGPFTALSVNGISGAIHSFVAKGLATPGKTGGKKKGTKRKYKSKEDEELEELYDFPLSESILYSQRIDDTVSKEPTEEISEQFEQVFKEYTDKDKDSIQVFKAKRQTIDQILNGPMAGMPLDEKSKKYLERTLKGQGFDSGEIWFLMEELL